jgi:hypothetical protein
VHRALWMLLGFQLRGWARYLARSLRTVKGAILAVVGILVLGSWLLAVVVSSLGMGGSASAGMDPDMVRRYGPVMLLVYCALNVFNASTERGIYFTPGEVNFLFPGPFGRRQLLAYKVASTLIVSTLTALMMALIIRIRGSWFPAAYLGMVLILAFMQLFTMALALVVSTLGASLYSRARRALLVAALVIVAGVGYQALDAFGGSDPSALLGRALDSPAWQVVSAPLRWLFEVLLARQLWPDLLEYTALGLLVDGGLLCVLFALDAHYLESSAATSARVYARLQRLRGKTTSEGEKVTGRTARLRVPFLPWWGGIGPTLWRQLTTAVRGSGRLAFLILIIGLVLGAPMLANLRGEAGPSVPGEAVGMMVLGMVLWLTILFTPLMPFDFRGDVDRIALLKTLPLPAWKLAVGQLLTPVLVMSTLHTLTFVGVATAFPATRKWLPVCLAYTLPFNFLLFALENLLFLLFPFRLMQSSPGDFQALGRNVLFLFAKGMVLVMVGMLAGIVGLIAYLISGSVIVGVLVPWPAVALIAAALIPLVALAFKRFDVSRDTPP